MGALSSPLRPSLSCAQLGDTDLGGHTPVMQREQMVSRGSLVSQQEVPGSVPKGTQDRCVHTRVWKVT